MSASSSARNLVGGVAGGELRNNFDLPGAESIDAADLLKDLGLRRVTLLTNNAEKIAGLEFHAAEEEAIEANFQVDIYRSLFRPLKHTLSGRDERTMMKLVVDQDSDKVLGCHMVGADAAEILQGLAVALNCGATKAQFDATIGIHPTAAEEFVTMRTKAA